MLGKKGLMAGSHGVSEREGGRREGGLGHSRGLGQAEREGEGKRREGLGGLGQ